MQVSNNVNKTLSIAKTFAKILKIFFCVAIVFILSMFILSNLVKSSSLRCLILLLMDINVFLRIDIR